MPDVLPAEFEFRHDLCLAMHDRLVSMVVFGQENDSFLTEVKLSDGEAERIENDPWDWMENRRSGNVLGEVLLKTIFPALLSDFCHFVFESLSCSRRGKLTVAYSLLRKPFLENLHFLEWLAAHPDGMLKTLYNRDAIERSSRRIRSNPDRILGVVKDAVKKTSIPTLHDPELLWEIRYDKNAEYSYDRYCNQAMHLVTTKKPIDTENQNFNFIFSDADCMYQQWQHIYRTLPILMAYTVDVSEYLMAVILGHYMDGCYETEYHRMVGLCLLGFDKSCDEEGEPISDDAKQAIASLEFKCEHCGHVTVPDEFVARTLYTELCYNCPKCYRQVALASMVSAT